MRTQVGHGVDRPLVDICFGISTSEHENKTFSQTSSLLFAADRSACSDGCLPCLYALNRDHFPPRQIHFQNLCKQILDLDEYCSMPQCAWLSGLYVPLQGNVFVCPRIEDDPCQLLRLPPSWMKGNHKLKPVCFQKYNLRLINTKFKAAAEYTLPTPTKNSAENRRFNSNALGGAVAAPLRHVHLLNLKHIKHGCSATGAPQSFMC